MRKRNQLQVNTFPFLAVLLCAMGALILVLLVMDRKAKLASLAKAQHKARLHADEAGAAVRREAETRRKAALTARDRKRDELRGRITAEERQLTAELQQVETRLAEAAARLRREEEAARKLRGQVKTEQDRARRQEQALQTAQQQASELAEKARGADRAREKLSGELQALEKALETLRAERRRDAETYSVVPYRGKHGDSRRPLYVECAAAGVIFHPDSATIDAEAPGALRNEIERRIVAQKAELAKQGVTQARPYLMVLVRPEGIVRYYQLQTAVRDLGVDFGYELVDGTWKLHFPGGEGERIVQAVPEDRKPATAPPADTATARLMPPGTGVGPSSGAPGVGTSGGAPGVDTRGSAPGSGAPGVGISGGAPGVGPSGPAVPRVLPSLDPPPAAVPGSAAMPSLDPPVGVPAVTSPGPVGPRVMPSLDPSAPVAGLSRPQPHPARPPGTGPAVAAPVDPDGNLPVPGLPGGGPSLGKPVPPANGGVVLPPLGSTGTTPSPAPAPAPAVTSQGQPAPAATAEPGPRAAPGFKGPDSAGDETPRREVPLRPARIAGTGDLTVFVECRADRIVLHPTRQEVALNQLGQAPLYNPLHQAVRTLMRRHREAARPGDPGARVLIRFLVHPDAERTYHLAYPPLETVSVPKARTTLLPGDDVQRIVSGD